MTGKSTRHEADGRPARALPGQEPSRARTGKVGLGGRLVWIVTGLVVLAALIALIVGAHSSGGSLAGTAGGAGEAVTTTATGPAVGDRAPDFTLRDLQGKPISLSSFHGRPVLLHFWAVDCTTCQAEQPTYLQAIKDLGKKAPVILAVDAWGESAEYVAPYVRRDHIPGTVLIDPPVNVFKILYRGEGTPTTFFIDPQGVIRQTVIGPESYSQLMANARAISA